MTTPAWPAGLPQKPDVDGWSEAPQPNRAQFQPEVGPPIRRRRGTARSYLVQAVFNMTDAQVATFWSFWQSDLKDGTLVFTWTHPVTGASARWSFETEPTASRVGYDWSRLSCQLRRLT